MSGKTFLVWTTIPDVGLASEIATRLVETRLAACIQIHHPVTSIYRWEGKTMTEKEVALSIKTRAENYPALEKEILRLHPFDVPEIIAVDIEKGLPDYLHWIEESTCKD